jgi:hypothetical protein
MSSHPQPCAHFDVRDFDDVRCCLSCGETVYLSDIPQVPIPHDPILPILQKPRLSYSCSDIQVDNGQEIRLVFLRPGDRADPLHCSIHNVSLDDNPQYEAVSYTWATEDGDDTKSARVHCDGTVIPITINCEAALRRLRLPSMVRILWVDSICINQTNIKERNHQVGVMDKIYKNASSVQICIQDRDRDYSECLRRLNGQEHCSRKSIDQTAELFRRRYFQRVWVIQEVLLARSAILLVNDDSAEITNANTGSFQEWCKRNRVVVPALLADPYVLQAAKNGTLSVAQCLQISMNSSSADPRDKVYGIFGILGPKFRTYLPVDYSLTLTQVYEKAVTACVIDTGSLSILCHVCLPSEIDLLTASVFDQDQFMEYLQVSVIEGQPRKLTRWSCWTFRVALHPEDGDIHCQSIKRQSKSYGREQMYKYDTSHSFGGEKIQEYRIFENCYSASENSEDIYRKFLRTGFDSGYTSVVETLTNVSPINQILTGFRVRAHFIDHVLGCTRSTPEDLAKKIFVENTNFTSVDYQWMHTSVNYQWMHNLRPPKA